MGKSENSAGRDAMPEGAARHPFVSSFYRGIYDNEL